MSAQWLERDDAPGTASWQAHGLAQAVRHLVRTVATVTLVPLLERLARLLEGR